MQLPTRSSVKKHAAMKPSSRPLQSVILTLATSVFLLITGTFTAIQLFETSPFTVLFKRTDLNEKSGNFSDNFDREAYPSFRAYLYATLPGKFILNLLASIFSLRHIRFGIFDS